MDRFGGCETCHEEIPIRLGRGELVALAVPNTYQILIPDVRPGTYRIRDEVADVVEDTPARITGFVLVEVLGSRG